MKDNYYNSIMMIENVHRLFLDVLKFELNKLKIMDINNVQAIMLYNISDRTLSVGDLTERGCYLGSNVSYNLRKLIENGYIFQEPQQHDRRSSSVKLTKKGLEMYRKLEQIFENQAQFIQEQGMNEERIKDFLDTLSFLDKNLRNIRR